MIIASILLTYVFQRQQNFLSDMMTLIHASPERTFSIQWSISESIFHSYQTYRAFCVHKLNKLATLKYSILVYHIYRVFGFK